MQAFLPAICYALGVMGIVFGAIGFVDESRADTKRGWYLALSFVTILIAVAAFFTTPILGVASFISGFIVLFLDVEVHWPPYYIGATVLLCAIFAGVSYLGSSEPDTPDVVSVDATKASDDTASADLSASTDVSAAEASDSAATGLSTVNENEVSSGSSEASTESSEESVSYNSAEWTSVIETEVASDMSSVDEDGNKLNLKAYEFPESSVQLTDGSKVLYIVSVYLNEDAENYNSTVLSFTAEGEDSMKGTIEGKAISIVRNYSIDEITTDNKAIADDMLQALQDEYGPELVKDVVFTELKVTK